MSIYHGKILWPAGQPYAGAYGNSYNVAVVFDPPAPVPPKQAEKYAADGAIRVYHNEGTKEAEYIRSLKKDDFIECFYVADKDKYLAVIPFDYEPEPATPVAQAQPAAQQARKSTGWSPLSDDDLAVWKEVAKNESDKLAACYVIINDWIADAPTEDKLDAAITLFISSNRVYKPGMVVEGNKDFDEEFLALLDPSNHVASLPVAVSIMHDSFTGADHVQATFIGLGIGSDDIDGTEKSALRLWHIAKFYGDMLAGGSPPSVALSATKDEYDLEKDNIPW